MVSSCEFAQLVFDVVATDTDPSDVTTITASALPDGATFSPCSFSGNQCTRTFRWTPQLGQGPVAFCMGAQSPGGSYAGAYCINLRQGNADIIYLSGVSQLAR